MSWNLTKTALLSAVALTLGAAPALAQNAGATCPPQENGGVSINNHAHWPTYGNAYRWARELSGPQNYRSERGGVYTSAAYDQNDGTYQNGGRSGWDTQTYRQYGDQNNGDGGYAYNGYEPGGKGGQGLNNQGNQSYQANADWNRNGEYGSNSYAYNDNGNGWNGGQNGWNNEGNSYGNRNSDWNRNGEYGARRYGYNESNNGRFQGYGQNWNGGNAEYQGNGQYGLNDNGQSRYQRNPYETGNNRFGNGTYGYNSYGRNGSFNNREYGQNGDNGYNANYGEDGGYYNR